MATGPVIHDIDTIRFEGLTFAHEGYDPTLANVDFEFPQAEAIWMKSPEGAGKSTVLQLLAGLLMPTGGKYLINGENVREMTFEEFLPYRLSIGYTFDYGGLINNKTIRDNLLLPLQYHNMVAPQVATERVDRLLKKFDLEKFKDERPAHVPGRVRKIACLLRAIVIEPQMLLMDDPSVGVGADGAKLFVEELEVLRSAGHLKHIIISSYDEKFMNLLNYDVIHIDQGQIYYQPEEKKVASL